MSTSDKAKALRRLAIRLQDVANLTREDIPVSADNYPGLKTQTLGGPKQTRHQQKHQQEGPRGEASAEDDEIKETE